MEGRYIRISSAFAFVRRWHRVESANSLRRRQRIDVCCTATDLQVSTHRHRTFPSIHASRSVESARPIRLEAISLLRPSSPAHRERSRSDVLRCPQSLRERAPDLQKVVARRENSQSDGHATENGRQISGDVSRGTRYPRCGTFHWPPRQGRVVLSRHILAAHGFFAGPQVRRIGRLQPASFTIGLRLKCPVSETTMDNSSLSSCRGTPGPINRAAIPPFNLPLVHT
jgi:hypothetical protein